MKRHIISFLVTLLVFGVVAFFAFYPKIFVFALAGIIALTAIVVIWKTIHEIMYPD